MPNQSTTKRAQEALREGKSPSTAAGEFVHEEIKHVRQGRHGARSPKQAIAIGLSKARRAGVPLPPPRKGKASQQARENAKRHYEDGKSGKAQRPSARASHARANVLKKESHSAASHQSLSDQARRAARKRSSTNRSASARWAAQTKGAEGRSLAAKKAAHTRNHSR